MKFARLLFLASLLLTISCSSMNYSRGQSLAEMPRLVEVEQKFKMLVMIFKSFRPSFTVEDAAKIEEAFDLYYVHHDAASVALASGQYENFHRHLELGRAELKGAEETIRRILGI